MELKHIYIKRIIESDSMEECCMILDEVIEDWAVPFTVFEELVELATDIYPLNIVEDSEAQKIIDLMHKIRRRRTVH